MYDTKSLPLFENKVNTSIILLCTFCRSFPIHQNLRDSYIIYKPDLTPIWDTRYCKKSYHVEFTITVSEYSNIRIRYIHNIIFDPSNLSNFAQSVKYFNTIKDIIEQLSTISSTESSQVYAKAKSCMLGVNMQFILTLNEGSNQEDSGIQNGKYYYNLLLSKICGDILKGTNSSNSIECISEIILREILISQLQPLTKKGITYTLKQNNNELEVLFHYQSNSSQKGKKLIYGCINFSHHKLSYMFPKITYPGEFEIASEFNEIASVLNALL